MRRGSKTHPEIRKRIVDLRDEGYNAVQIVAKLTLERGDAPNERTVRGIIAAERPRDGSGTWSFADADADEAALVLPVLHEVIKRSEGRVFGLTIAEAQWIARIRRAVPRVPAWAALLYARQYIARGIAGRATDDMDRELAQMAAGGGGVMSFGVNRESIKVLGRAVREEGRRNDQA